MQTKTLYVKTFKYTLIHDAFKELTQKWSILHLKTFFFLMLFNIVLVIANLCNALNFSNKSIHCFNKSFGRGSSQLNLFVQIIQNNIFNCNVIRDVSPRRSNVLPCTYLYIDVFVIPNDNVGTKIIVLASKLRFIPKIFLDASINSMYHYN